MSGVAEAPATDRQEKKPVLNTAQAAGIATELFGCTVKDGCRELDSYVRRAVRAGVVHTQLE